MLILIAIGILLLAMAIIYIINSKKTNTNPNQHVCSAGSRGSQVCFELYQPVCGYPNTKTYSNSCFACIDNSVQYYINGQCPQPA